MKIKEAMKDVKENIGYIESKMLMEYTLNEDENYLIINAEKDLTNEQEENFKKYVEEVIDGKPLQYITHSQEFMETKFYVDENVLIPQPDTESVVQYAIQKIQRFFAKENKVVRILDLCTGSGAIAISLKKYMDMLHINCEVTASDISKEALKVAQKNCKEILRNNDIKLVESDMFEKIEGTFDIIISNPPYIKTDVIKDLPIDVQNEPEIALDGGKDGLDFYRKIRENVERYLTPEGYIFMEIGYDEALDVMRIFRNSECFKDYNKNDRVIIWQK